MFFFPLTRKGRLSRKAAKALYAKIVKRAREPVFYTDLQVPDSFTGRFELVALHTGLAINRLRREGAAGALLAQSLFDEMVLNMDMACRQSGIGDLGVPKQIKKMTTALQGRALVYDAAAKSGISDLAEALNKNLYATVETPQKKTAEALAVYIIDSIAKLEVMTLAEFTAGQIVFAGLPIARGGRDGEISQVA